MDGLRRRLEGAALDQFIASTQSRSWSAARSNTDDSLDVAAFEMRLTPTLSMPSALLSTQSTTGADASRLLQHMASEPSTAKSPRGRSRPRTRPPSMDELRRLQEARALDGFMDWAARARPEGGEGEANPF